MSFWDMKFRNLGGWVINFLNPVTLPARTVQGFHAYKAKYVLPRNAGIRPFFHVVAVAMFLNYMIEFKHLRKHEMFRKYH